MDIDELVEKRRIFIVGAILLAGILLLVANLYVEQLHMGDEYQARINRQSVRRIRIPSRRGKILTSDRKILADTQVRYELYFYLDEMRQKGGLNKTLDFVQQRISELAARLETPIEITRDDITRHINLSPGLPLQVLPGLSDFQMALVYEYALSNPGVAILPSNVRVYPYGGMAAHLLGFTRLEMPGQASDRREYSYYISDIIGKSGLESRYDFLPPGVGQDTLWRGLRGAPGFSLVQVDNRGSVNRVLVDEVAPADGNSLVLTLDFRAQLVAEKLMRDQVGAMVVLDVDTGGILACVSAPGYDLSALAPEFDNGYFRRINSDKRLPMYNRALSGIYTPGSIFKPMVMLKLLEKGMSGNQTVDCDGGTRVGKIIRCASWRSGGHGLVTPVTALRYSCNDFMIEETLKYLKANDFDDILSRFKVGESLGFDLAVSRGVRPSEEYLTRNKRRWSDFEAAHASIGQGLVVITPLHAAMFAASIARDGEILRPFLVEALVDGEGNELKRFKAEKIGELPGRKEDLALVRRGMYEVVNSNDGSGRLAAGGRITLYGKTGSAQVDTPAGRIENSWFICFGEYRNRRYALSVLVEEGVSGGKTAAPLAKAFFEEFLPENNP
ncbi:MAG: hypothetical protein MST10_08515 [Lentisphaeria bacterium]|nr:hypothetical protein [Lentisphaeria bacterium]